MSAVPADDPRSLPSAAPEPGWHVKRCLTLSQAEELLDYLESCGAQQREALIEPTGGVTVRWRGAFPRLVE